MKSEYRVLDYNNLPNVDVKGCNVELNPSSSFGEMFNKVKKHSNETSWGGGILRKYKTPETTKYYLFGIRVWKKTKK